MAAGSPQVVFASREMLGNLDHLYNIPGVYWTNSIFQLEQLVSDLLLDTDKSIKPSPPPKINMDISINNIEDKKILGGIKLQVGNTLIDGSLATKLEKLKQSMINK